MSDCDAFDAFTAKWRARWPEWALADVFVPNAQRDAAVAWWALLDEWAEAAWGGSDPAPGLAKLAWWQDELRGWGKGARRHPLGAVLRRAPAPWAALADALPALRTRDLPTQGIDAVRHALQPLGAAMTEVELALFGGPSADAGEVAVALATPYLPAESRVAETAHSRSGSRVRRLYAALASLRADAYAGSRAIPRWRVLLAAWRAARN